MSQLTKEHETALRILRDFAAGHCNMTRIEASLVVEAIDQLKQLPVLDIECGHDKQCHIPAAAPEPPIYRFGETAIEYRGDTSAFTRGSAPELMVSISLEAAKHLRLLLKYGRVPTMQPHVDAFNELEAAIASTRSQSEEGK